MKRTLAILLDIIFILLALTQGVFAAEFPDVTVTHTNYDAIMHLTDLGVIAGYDDGTFCPEREITRTEFCALMARTMGYSKDTYIVKDVPFKDVSANYWGRAYISFCYERGLINGMGEGIFAPADKVTMGQIAKMAVCAVGKESEAQKTGGEKWYSGYVAAAELYGLLDETNQQPDENAVRANVAQVVYNMVMSGMVEDEPPADEEKPEDNSGEEDIKDTDGESTDEEELSEIEKAFLEKDYSDVKVILIDPGHNYEGKDTGARYELYNAVEEVITWQIADKLRTKLVNLGYTVVMTREKMTDSIANTSATESLQARVDMAHTSLADLYISVHCNMGGGTGTETYCYTKGGYAERLAKLVQNKVSAATGFYDRGVKTANFFVIKNTLMPSILIETGFMDTKQDALLLTTEYGQELYAQAIADAVLEYDNMEPLQTAEAEVDNND